METTGVLCSFEQWLTLVQIDDLDSVPKEMFQLYSLENVVFLLWTKCLHEAYIDTFLKLRTESLLCCGCIVQARGPTGRKRSSGRNEWSAGWTSLLIWNSMKTVSAAGVADSIPCFRVSSKNGISCQGLEQEAWSHPEASQWRLCELSGSAPELWQCTDCSCGVAGEQAFGVCISAWKCVGLWFWEVSTPRANYGNKINSRCPVCQAVDVVKCVSDLHRCLVWNATNSRMENSRLLFFLVYYIYRSLTSSINIKQFGQTNHVWQAL